MFKILTKREKIILYLTLGIITLSLGFNFIITPILMRNENLSKEINLSQVRIKKYHHLLNKKDYLQSEYNKLGAVPRVSGQPEDEVVNALSELENLAKKAEIRIIDLRPQGVSRTTPAYKEVAIDLRTEGMMKGYINFIYHLENSPSLLRIKRFQLNSKPNSPALDGIFSIVLLSIRD